MKYLWLLFPLVLVELLAEDPARTAPWSSHVTSAQELERQGDIRSAEVEFRLAAAEAQRNGTGSARFANVIDAMGVFYDDIGNFVEAENCLTRSLAIWRRLLGTEHVAIARVINRLAALYLETGQIGKAERLDLESWIHRAAEPLLKNALTIAEKSFGPTSLRTAAVLDSYARFLRERKRTSEARRMQARLRQIMSEAGPGLPSRHTVDVTELSLRGEQ